MSDEKKLKIAQFDWDNPNMSIDDMPDCRRKFKVIRERGIKYTDVKWDPIEEESKVLGADMRPS